MIWVGLCRAAVLFVGAGPLQHCFVASRWCVGSPLWRLIWRLKMRKRLCIVSWGLNSCSCHVCTMHVHIHVVHVHVVYVHVVHVHVVHGHVWFMGICSCGSCCSCCSCGSCQCCSWGSRSSGMVSQRCEYIYIYISLC